VTNNKTNNSRWHRCLRSCYPCLELVLSYFAKNELAVLKVDQIKVKVVWTPIDTKLRLKCGVKTSPYQEQLYYSIRWRGETL